MPRAVQEILFLLPTPLPVREQDAPNDTPASDPSNRLYEDPIKPL
jgi:hypothetical protein